MLAWRTAVFALLLVWPLILFGRPTYLTGDSLAYFKVGRQSVEFAASKLNPPADDRPVTAPAGASTPAAASASPPGADTKTSRSVPYAVATYVLRWPGNDMTGLALAQILAASLLCAMTAGVAGVKRRRDFLCIAVIVALASPLAVFASFIVPDIWTGLLLGAMILMIVGLDRLALGARLLLAGMIAFAVTSHASIPPLAAGMMLVGAVVLFLRSRLGLARVRHAWAWLVIPPLIGFATTSAIGFISFGEVSVTGKRIPTALARSVSHGPARWYLERECVKPRYAICEVFGTKIPHGIDELLFAKNSLNDLATPEQMDRIRAEESEIVLNAARAYPGTEIEILSVDILRQLSRYDLGLTNFKMRVALDSTGTPQLVATGRDHSSILRVIDILTNIGLALSLGWAIWMFGRLANRERVTLLLLAAGIMGNVLICVVFSAVAERYQARIIWLVPLFVLSTAAARINRRSAPETGGSGVA